MNIVLHGSLPIHSQYKKNHVWCQWAALASLVKVKQADFWMALVKGKLPLLGANWPHGSLRVQTRKMCADVHVG
jgi:hypothetical protein